MERLEYWDQFDKSIHPVLAFQLVMPEIESPTKRTRSI